MNSIERDGARGDDGRIRLEAAMHQAGEAIVILGAQREPSATARIQYVNAAFTRMTGYRPEEAIGRTLRLLLKGTGADATFSKIQEAMQAGSSVRTDVVNHRKDGSAYWSGWTLTPVTIEGQLAHWMCIQRDVTRQKQTDARNRIHAALLHEAQDAIFVLDVEGHISYWNKSAERLFGWKSQEVIERRADGLLLEPGDLLVKEALRHTLEQASWMGELEIVSRSGEAVTVVSRWSLIQGSQHKPQSILVVNTDVTEKKQLEAQLLRSQRLESIGALASGIAHDLNNVLNPVVMATDMLQKLDLDPESRHLIETIAQNARRGSAIVKQVLDFAQGAAAKRTIVHPLTFIRSIEELIRETFPRSIKIRVDVSQELWAVQGDPTQLEQIIMNLCVNARDAMSGGGILEITGSNARITEEDAQLHVHAKPGPYVKLYVSDTGEGIAPGVIDRIFEPFFTTKKPGQGTGLGLPTVQRIVHDLGGFLQVRSEPGKGTTFSIYLPAVDDEVQKPVKQAVAAPKRGHGELILLADDEVDMLAVVKTMLERNGYQVITARNGRVAVDLFKEKWHQIQAVVTDLMMPEMDGFDTIRALLEIDPQVRILATSGFVSKENLVLLAKAGAHAFLPKPFTIERLLTTLEALVIPQNQRQDRQPQTPPGASRSAAPTDSLPT